MSTGRPEEWIVVTEDAKTLPVIELLTGRGFITGKSGSGKSNTASVVAEELLDANFNLLVVDLEGEYYGLKEQYQVLHVGADDRCDVQVAPQDAETVADVALHRNMPTVLDVSGFTDVDESKAMIHGVLEALYEKERDAQKPFLIIVEEIQEHLPQSGGKDDLAKLLIRIAKRGRKRGLGMTGISQRPSSVDKDFITQCDWMVWHRLTWKNDIGVVKDILGTELADQIQDLGDGEAFLMTDWDETVERVQFKRKRTFDAGATPGLQEFERPDLVDVSNDLLDELGEDLTAEQMEATEPATLEDLGGEPADLEAPDAAATDRGAGDEAGSDDGASAEGSAPEDGAADGTATNSTGDGASGADATLADAETGAGTADARTGSGGGGGTGGSGGTGDPGEVYGETVETAAGGAAAVDGATRPGGVAVDTSTDLESLDRDALISEARALQERTRVLEDEVAELRSVLENVRRRSAGDTTTPAFDGDRPTTTEEADGHAIRRPSQPGPASASGPAGVVEEFGHLVRYVLAAVGFLLIDGTRWLARLPARLLGRVDRSGPDHPIRARRRSNAVLVGVLGVLLLALGAAVIYLLFVQ